MLSIIVAMAKNRIIGLDNKMPWHLPADLAWFKQNTLNKTVIMGRKTYESIGRPLPNRHNIVISRQIHANDSSELSWVTSIDEALLLANQQHHSEIFVIGGGNIYQQVLPQVDRLYLTHIDAALTGDTHFPNYLEMNWTPIFQENHIADAKNPFNYQFEILVSS